jgi:hypothetical protein
MVRDVVTAPKTDVPPIEPEVSKSVVALKVGVIAQPTEPKTMDSSAVLKTDKVTSRIAKFVTELTSRV